MAELNAKLIQELVAATVAATIAEVRKPAPPTAKELSELQMAQADRKQSADAVRQERENKRAAQAVCSHSHSQRDGGGTHAVWVREDGNIPSSPGFIYCQKCEARIRPEGELMRKLDPQATFDTALFNRLFQDCNSSEMFGG